MNDQLFEQIFQLRFASKMLQNSAKRAEKESKKKKTQVASYIKKGELDIARIYASDSIRKHNEAMNFLRLSSRIDGVKSRLETVQATKQVTQALVGVTKTLGKSIEEMNLEQVEKTLSQFSEKFEDFEVMEQTVTQTMDKTTANMVKQDDVDSLIQEVAEEHNLQLKTLLPDLVPQTKGFSVVVGPALTCMPKAG